MNLTPLFFIGYLGRLFPVFAVLWILMELLRTPIADSLQFQTAGAKAIGPAIASRFDRRITKHELALLGSWIATASCLAAKAHRETERLTS